MSFVTIKVRRGTTTQWNSTTKNLANGEIGFNTTLNKFKIGTGSTPWADLQYLNTLPSEFNELVQDAVDSALVAGTGISKNYNDAANTLTISVDTTIANKAYVDAAVAALGSTAADTYIPASLYGNPDGVASLDATGKVPDSEIPTAIARLASPTLTGTPAAPTATAGTNTTQVATTAFVGTAVSNLVNAAPESLNTLKELSDALGADANFATTTATSIGNKVSKAGGDTITSSTASTVPLVLKAAASQTANLQEWQTSAGTVESKIDATGQFISKTCYLSTAFIGGGISGTIGQANVSPFQPSRIGLVVRGTASQTANLQEWQNSAGIVLAKVDAYGNIDLPADYSSLTVGEGSGKIGWSQTYFTRTYSSALVTMVQQNLAGAGFLIQSGNAGTVPLQIKGAASQTANLQEWQNSSGTILSKVDASGAMFTITPTAGANTTQVATTEFVRGEVAALVNIKYATSSAATTYTISSSNTDKMTEFTAATEVTITIPDDPLNATWPIGSSLELRQMGLGRLKFVVTAPATIVSTDDYLKTRTRYSSVFLEKRASNSWILTGDIDA